MTREQLEDRNKQLEAQVLVLTQQLDHLKRQLFGRKSERFEHPELFDPAVPGKDPSSGDAAAPEDKPQAAAQATQGRERKTRAQRVPEHIPVV